MLEAQDSLPMQTPWHAWRNARAENSMKKPSDLVPQQQAAQQVGKSIDTIRRWRNKDVIKTFKLPGSRAALVSLKEVMLVAGLQAQSHDASAIAPANTLARADDMQSLMNSHLQALESQVRDLQTQRDDLAKERSFLLEELKEMRGENRQLQSRLNEMTAAGGVRGFLRGLRR